MKVSVISTVVAAAFFTSALAAPAPVPNQTPSHKPSFRPVDPSHIKTGANKKRSLPVNAAKRATKSAISRRTSHEHSDYSNYYGYNFENLHQGTHCDIADLPVQLYGSKHIIHQISKDLKNSGHHKTIKTGECFEIGCLPDFHGAWKAEDFTGAIVCQLPHGGKTREAAQVSTHEMGRGLDKIVEYCAHSSYQKPQLLGIHVEKAYEVITGSGFICAPETLTSLGGQPPNWEELESEYDSGYDDEYPEDDYEEPVEEEEEHEHGDDEWKKLKA